MNPQESTPEKTYLSCIIIINVIIVIIINFTDNYFPFVYMEGKSFTGTSQAERLVQFS